ncbi:two-component regulator propeller domain-containing protein [Wenyingzhuangia sp. chi5]|uniref:histidine kinase n=1 Tax=Wenyingzhuangia gilva TaxID=3057677 RepID=A0ABT8VUI9_9FLAO|nr:hybrid sensor histidine kinase/response regulator transcription factor [Wenyingzhuangia sp. chi5]MDO3695639.1 two-component regulator propeller domain-containing protein [Wenyingzhuangia sp. chi5]
MLKPIVFLFFIISLFTLNAQSLKFEHYNSRDGLSHNSVRHIIQDNQGFLWLGTFSGLNRFDGYQFKSYLSTSLGKNKIYNDDITVLRYDESLNNIWIGTRDGLTLFEIDTQKFTTFLPEKNNPNSLPDREIRSLYIDKFKRIWVGTKTKGLCVFYPDENKFIKIELPDFNYVKEIYDDKKGNLWIGSYETAGVAKLSLDHKGNVVAVSKYSLSIPNSNNKNPYINFIHEDFKSDIFVGTREGLYKLNKASNTFEIIQIEDKVLRDQIGNYFLSIARSPNGKYWIGTLSGILVCNQLEDLKTANFQWHYSVLTENTSLADNLISSLYFDPSGVLWIGTEDGLDKYDPYENQIHLNKEVSLYTENQIPRNRGFAQTYDGKLILATWHNGLFITKKNSFVPLYKNKEDISSIYTVDGKIFFCGLWNGKIMVYNYLNNTSKTIDVGFVNSAISSFLKYNEETLLVGSFGEGIVYLDIKNLSVKTSTERLFADYEINKIKKSGDDLWIAAEEGIIKYNLIQKTTKLYQHNPDIINGLPQDNLSDVLIDSKNRVWAATRAGLAKYVPEMDAFELVTEFPELKGKWITDMTLVTDGSLWLNINNNTIGKYNADLKTVNIYHVKSGTRLDVFSSRGFYNYNNSLIYIGGKYGVISFSPNTIMENKYSPKPFITEFKVQNKEVLPGMKINGQTPFKKDINIAGNVVLDYNNRNFSIQFSTPSYTNERLNKFQYMLEGFDDDWIEVNSDSRTVQYTNLFSKNYTFKIKSSNSDGVWSDVSTYQIKVLPSFWLTYKGLFIIGFSLVLLLFFLNRQIKLKKELLYEKVKREREEKLNNEKLRFFTNISHELRTPLTLILGPIKQLLDHHENNDYAKSRVDLIHLNANRLLRLVNQILDFRKAEKGKLALKVSKVNVLKITQNVVDSFLVFAQSKNINFNLNIDDEAKECWIDVDKYDKILFNLLSNAMKFTNHFGNIDLFIGVKNEQEKTLIIEVCDDGIGIPIESQEKIFSRFYQANNSKENTTGSGIGLSFVKALVDIHKGKISVKSTPNKGSVFTVELPVYKEAYQATEILDSIPYQEHESEFITVDSTSEVLLENIKRVQQNTEIKHKVVIIEDNTELRKYIVEYLSGFYKVYEAENGQEGLELCRKVRPALCVADVMMPVMDGFDFVEALKSDENISNTAVILLTALAENENRIKGYEIGVDDYLVKPFDPFVLKSRIDNIIKTHFNLKQKFSGEVETDVITLAHSQIDIDLITEIKELIDEHMGNSDLTMGFLCETLAMSTSKLYRKITQLTDMSPSEFIRTIRLKKSAELLKTKKYNVSEVANMVGFNDPLYFSRCFKKQFGIAPSTLIK